jgi:site-specific DNA recombinase
MDSDQQAPIPLAGIGAGSRGARRSRLTGPGGSHYLSQGPLRVAVAARTSTEDQQDPTLSIPRQVHNCRAALPDNAAITCYFYDIESGRKDLASRGKGRGHERFSIPVPRDGGLQDLLAEAARPDRRFDAVICESIDRIARRTYIATLIENQLEQAGVLLLAADEPIVLNGKRASQILTRRVKQGVAEWYVLELLEKSWGGFEAHTDQGYNVGKPPYGYLAHKIPHPVPARRAEGASKHTLVPDPARGPVVTQMYAWRVGERLGYAAIADRLNRDLDRYPPPIPVDPSRAVGRWTTSSVRDVLTNPKYTGYMVWNRRATKTDGGKHNPPEAWVWSGKLSHESLVTKDVFLAAQKVAPERERSRSTSTANTKHPATTRSYCLRSFVICSLCDRRMFGKVRRNTVYYACEPSRAYRPPGHPTSLWVREEHLLNGIAEFFAEKIFSPHRKTYLSAALAESEQQAVRDHHEKMQALRRAVDDIETRRSRLVRNLELTDDPDGELTRDVRTRVTQLATEKKNQLATLAELEQTRPTPHRPELLDLLPTGAPDLTRAPEPLLRAVFEAFRLEIRYDKSTNIATCRVAIAAEAIDTQQRTATQVIDATTDPDQQASVPICVAPPAGHTEQGNASDRRRQRCPTGQSPTGRPALSDSIRAPVRPDEMGVQYGGRTRTKRTCLRAQPFVPAWEQ